MLIWHLIGIDGSVVFLTWFRAGPLLQLIKKRALLFHLAGPDVQDLYEALVALEGEEGKNAYGITVGRLNNYFAPKSSKTFERHLFRKIIQQAGETCDQFLTRL